MTFVNPLLLAGAALVALPIVLHLIMRRKPRHLEFPALRFVQQRHETNRRQLRLRHLLLLLLRMAAIVLLAAALARPSMKFSGVLGSREAPVAAALVFDCSPRMEYRHENRTRLEAARELGLWLLKQLPRQSRIAVLDTRLGRGVFQIDRGAAAQRIERLEMVANSQPLTAVTDEALRLLATSELDRKEVYIFTDLTRSAWPGDWAARPGDREAPEAGVYLIDVGVADPADFALGEVRLSRQVLSSRSPLRIESELACTGPGGERTIELTLLDAERKPQKRDQRSVMIEADASGPVEFRIGSLGVGTHQGFLRIVGQDSLACDDTRYFTVEVKPPWRILVVAPAPAERYALFLVEALAPSTFRRSGQARFDCDIVAQEELSSQALQPYSAVCLLDPKPLAPALWRKLADYVSDGHALAVFLGRNARPVEAFNQAEAQELFPGRLVRQARAPGGDVYLAPRHLQHPVLAEMRDWAGSIPWDASPVYRYWQLDKLARGVQVVVPFTDGRPAVLERPLGRGRVMTMTTPVSDRADEKAWNLLPLGEESWPFVILVNQMMLYLVGGSDEQLNYQAGQTAVVPLGPREDYRSYLLTAPGEVQFPLSADPKQNVLVITSTDKPGNYRIQAGGRDSGVDRGFSVNLAPRQTQLDRLTEEELRDVFGPLEFRIARERDEIERDVNLGRVGRELFPLLILLVALALGGEYVLANRFYKE